MRAGSRFRRSRVAVATSIIASYGIQGEHLFEPVRPLSEVVTEDPELLQRTGQAQTVVRAAAASVRQAPGERRTEIVELGGDPVEPDRAVRTERTRLELVGERPKPAKRLSHVTVVSDLIA